MLKSYLQKILEIARQGDAREESFYSILEALINEFATSTNKKNIHSAHRTKNTETQTILHHRRRTASPTHRSIDWIFHKMAT